MIEGQTQVLLSMTIPWLSLHLMQPFVTCLHLEHPRRGSGAGDFALGGGPPAASPGCVLGLRDRSRLDIVVRLFGGWATRQVCDQAGTYQDCRPVDTDDAHRESLEPKWFWIRRVVLDVRWLSVVCLVVVLDI